MKFREWINQLSISIFYSHSELPLAQMTRPKMKQGTNVDIGVEQDIGDIAKKPGRHPTLDSADVPSLVRLVAEMATCVWYVKTKYFEREWANGDTDDENPRVRRVLGRLNKVIDSFNQGGFEVRDPTNERYPQGGEGTMRPIQFEPKSGLSFDVVTEVVVPIIFGFDQLIQRGEVFVAIPENETNGPEQSGVKRS